MVTGCSPLKKDLNYSAQYTINDSRNQKLKEDLMKNISMFLIPLLIQATISCMNSSPDWAQSILTQNFADLNDCNKKHELANKLTGEFNEKKELLCHTRKIFGEPDEWLTLFDMSRKELDSCVVQELNGLANNKFKFNGIDAIKQLKKRLIAFSYQQGGAAWLCNLKTKECAQFDDHKDYSILGFALNEKTSEIAVIWSEPETEQKIIDVYNINMQFKRAKSNG